MLRLLTDEDVHGAILAGLHRRQPELDLVRVQDVGLGHSPDPIILDWAGSEGRVVVSVDKRTLAAFAWDRVAQGLPMPGVAILRTVLTIGKAIDELEILAIAGSAEDLRDQVIYLPL